MPTILILGTSGFLIWYNPFVLNESVEKEIETQFDSIVNVAELEITLEILKTLKTFDLLSSAFSEVNIELKTFNKLVEIELDISPYRAIEWIPIVSHADRQQIEMEAQQDYNIIHGFRERNQNTGQLQPRQNSQVYYPVRYILPVESNENAILFDLGSEENRLATIEKALNTKSPSTTNVIRLVQTGTIGFLLYMPIIINNNVESFLLGVWDFDALFVPILTKLKTNVGQVHLQVNMEETPVFSSKFGDDILELEEIPDQISPEHTFNQTIADKNLVLKIYRDENFSIGISTQVPITITITIISVFAIMILVFFFIIIRLSQKKLKHANRHEANTKKYLAMIAHDLKTPVAAIDMLISQSNVIEPDIKQHIGASVEILRNTVLNITQYVKMSLEKNIIPNSTSFNLPKTIKNIVMIISTYGVNDHVPIHVQYEYNFISNIETDKQWFVNIVLNLLSNARKFTNSGEINIVVSYDPITSMMNLKVIDTGTGISDENKKKLFAPFSQLQNDSGGSGLGLFNIKKYTYSLGGSCGVEDNLQEIKDQDGNVVGTKKNGSLFWIEIPVKFTPLNMLTPTNASEPSPNLLDHVKNIMVVDDTRTIRLILKRILQKLFPKYEIYDAGSGREAIETLKTVKIDIMFLDINMPELSGFDVIEIIKNENIEMPLSQIVMCTASTDEENVNKCYEYGVYQILEKPFSKDKLAKIFQNLEKMMFSIV